MYPHQQSANAAMIYCLISRFNNVRAREMHPRRDPARRTFIGSYAQTARLDRPPSLVF